MKDLIKKLKEMVEDELAIKKEFLDFLKKQNDNEKQKRHNK